MKKEIHPKYAECTVKCVCGNTFITRSSVAHIDIEVCNACHPTYTGQKKIVDSTGRVDRFKKLLGHKKTIVRSKKEKRVAKSIKKIEKKSVIQDAKTEKN